MSFDPNILAMIEADLYLADDIRTRTLVEAIHATSEVGHKLQGAYFRILLARTVSDMKIRKENAEPCLARQHKAMYKQVTSVVITPDIAADSKDSSIEKERKYQERQSRTKFASTAKSTIASALKVGIDITSLDLKTINKNALYAQTVDLRVTTPDQLMERALSNIDKASDLFDEVMLVGTEAQAAAIAVHTSCCGTIMTTACNNAKGGKP